MDSPTIIVVQPRRKRITESFIFLLILSVIFGTFLRASLMIIYPLIAIFIGLFYNFKITSSIIQLLVCISICLGLSFFGGFFIKYKLLSLFYMLPFIFLLFSNPSAEKIERIDQLSIFMKCMSLIVLVNNIIGVMQLFMYPDSDDSFKGLYSQFSVSINGLTLLNTILFYYYFSKFESNKNKKHLFAGIFFLLCAILGFYGAGLIVTIMALILTFVRFQWLSIIKTLVIGIAIIAGIYFTMLVLKPLTLDYNLANLKKIASFDIANGPRKPIVFYNYATSYPFNIKDFLFGSGPGTFNSRSAFIIGSPSYFNKFEFIKNDHQPYYFKKYAYSLWNESNTSQALYLDGFRNQPFSSLLTFLGEYGLLFTVAFFCCLGIYFTNVSRLYKKNRDHPSARLYLNVFKFHIFLLILLLIIDNYFEYPEIIIPLLLAIKFSHQGLLNLEKIKLNDLATQSI